MQSQHIHMAWCGEKRPKRPWKPGACILKSWDGVMNLKNQGENDGALFIEHEAQTSYYMVFVITVSDMSVDCIFGFLCMHGVGQSADIYVSFLLDMNIKECVIFLRSVGLQFYLKPWRVLVRRKASKVWTKNLLFYMPDMDESMEPFYVFSKSLVSEDYVFSRNANSPCLWSKVWLTITFVN